MVAQPLNPRLAAIVAEVNDADPPLHGHESIADVAGAVRRFLAEHHPELSPDAVEVVVRKVTYDWR